jgi:hypothetical protein
MTTIRRAALVALAHTALASSVAAQSALERAAATITEAEYLHRVGVIAHDSMFGRDTPSPGLEKTAAWIASELRSFGLRGGAEDGSFVQRYPLRSLVVDVEASGLSGGARRLEYGRDLVPLIGANGAGEATAGILLVSGTRDLGRALADNAVRAQHAVLVLPANAPGVDQEALRYAMTLRNAGAASVLVTSNADDEDWSANAVRALEPGVAKGWEAPSFSAGPFRPTLVVRTSALADLLRGRSVDLAALQARGTEAARVDRVQGLTLTLTQRVREEEITAPNVVGILEGSDPALRDEYVVFSAHMDHVGIGAPDQRGDSIFNGADDDASGTIAVVEIAEAMASLPTPPRRSMLFLLVSGEEKGLWGSEYFANNPPVPASQMVANLNMDMVGRNWTDTIVAIGKEHSDLGATLERVNRARPELRMTAIDDLWPQESFYTRSDHYNFAVKGVPILFFFNGTHEDYHGRDDEVERIDAEKAARIARLVFYLGAEIGNADARPAWNPESYARIVGGRR